MQSDLYSLDLTARGLHMLKYNLWTDIQFEVGKNKTIIKAHRLFLRGSSPVFESIISEQMTDNKDPPYPLPDISPDIFNIVIHFIYTDRVESATSDQLPEIDYVTKKFEMPRLKEAFVDSLIKTLNAENAIICYEYATALECQPLIDECTEIFKTSTQILFSSESIKHAKLSTLEYIFSLENLVIFSEMDLLTVVEAYAKLNKNEELIEIAGDELKLSVRPLLQQIRFLCLKPDIMAGNYHRLREFLSDHEILCLMINLIRRGDKPMPEGFSQNESKRNLEMPFLLPIQGEMKEGRVFVLQGVVEPDAKRFDVDFKTNNSVTDETGTAFHISVRFMERCVVRNTFARDHWGREERAGGMPFRRGEPFEITIVVGIDRFEVSVDSQHFCSYVHRMPYSAITHFGAARHITLTGISC